MGIKARLLLVMFAVILASFEASAQSAAGRIDGLVTGADGEGIGAVIVVVHETGQATVTDSKGYFALSRVPAGAYRVVFTLGGQVTTRTGVIVNGGQTAHLDVSVAWAVRYAETLTVFSASRELERVVEAPAAVTIIGEEEIARKAANAQVPKLLEFTPGAEITQSGVYDFNFNMRGFNSSLNRRVATLIDGRDPSLPFLGAQEWAAVSFPLDDLAHLELVRGPSAALYGANASSGVLNLSTRPPRYSQGGTVRITAGELATTHVDFRWAGKLGNDWYMKVVGGLRDSADFTVSRNGAAEYSVPCPVPQGTATDCLPQEAVALARMDDDRIVFGGLRFDKYLDGGSFFTIEGGMANVEGPTFQTGIGRVQTIDVERPWARFSYSADHWNLLAYYTARNAPEQLALASGANVALDTERIQIEGQTHWTLAADRVRLVAGASLGDEEIDTRDPATGMQTLTRAPVDNEKSAVFAQVDWQLTDKVKLVAAGRWDDSDLHDAEVSPKASVVYGVNPSHTLRLTYNEAFQVANYSEFFLFTPAGLPADLTMVSDGMGGTTDLEAQLCGSSGVTCGLGVTPVMAVGNKDLELEQIQTFEIGYSGIIAGRTFVTADYYNSNNENFITDLIRVGGTALGRINPNISPWVGPDDAENTMSAVVPGLTVAETVRLAVPALSSDPLLGNTIAVTYTNFGEVDTQGVDLGLNHYFNDSFNLSFTYSWFDFDVVEDAVGLRDLLLPNSPEHKFSVGLAYRADRWNSEIGWRWVDDFRWTVGPFQGPVDSYSTVDLGANYRFDERWSLGLNVANLLDNRHWESFGGDLLERRALANVAFSWD